MERTWVSGDSDEALSEPAPKRALLLAFLLSQIMNFF